MKASTLLTALAVAATGNSLVLPTNGTHYLQTGITTSAARIFRFFKGPKEVTNGTSAGNSSVVRSDEPYTEMKGSTIKMSKYYVEPRPVINVTYTGSNHSHVALTNRTHHTGAGITVSSDQILKDAVQEQPTTDVTYTTLNMTHKDENRTVDAHTVKMEVVTSNGLPETKDKEEPYQFESMILRHGFRIVEPIPAAKKSDDAADNKTVSESATSTKVAEPTKTVEAAEQEKPAEKTQEAEPVGNGQETIVSIPNREDEIHKISRGGGL